MLGVPSHQLSSPEVPMSERTQSNQGEAGSVNLYIPERVDAKPWILVV
jgi:hypothetical protein